MAGRPAPRRQAELDGEVEQQQMSDTAHGKESAGMAWPQTTVAADPLSTKEEWQKAPTRCFREGQVRVVLGCRPGFDTGQNRWSMRNMPVLRAPTR